MRSAPRKRRGQSQVEYVLVCAALALALLVPVRDTASPDQPRSALGILIQGFRTAYEKFSYATSLPD
jgi:hypothetical protein